MSQENYQLLSASCFVKCSIEQDNIFSVTGGSTWWDLLYLDLVSLNW
jgi:hypothetical protein